MIKALDMHPTTLSTIDSVTARIKQHGVIAIVRGNYTRPELLTIGRALYAGGVRLMEVTLNSANALDGIRALREQLLALESDQDRMLVGAGTIRTPAQVSAAADAGAEFLIAPNFDPACVLRAKERNLLHIPGVFTATEAQAAINQGCRLLKLFPSDTVGPNYLKALRAPLDDAEFIPTGGITPESLGDYIRAGAVAIGAGSQLVPKQPVAHDDLSGEIEARARAFVTAWIAVHEVT